jgi:hypothetical protein
VTLFHCSSRAHTFFSFLPVSLSHRHSQHCQLHFFFCFFLLTFCDAIRKELFLIFSLHVNESQHSQRSKHTYTPGRSSVFSYYYLCVIGSAFCIYNRMQKAATTTVLSLCFFLINPFMHFIENFTSFWSGDPKFLQNSGSKRPIFTCLCSLERA